MLEFEGILLDIDYISMNENSIIRLFFKSDEGKKVVLDKTFKPYFFVIPKNSVEKTINEIKDFDKENKISNLSVIKKIIFRENKRNVIKVEVNQTIDVKHLREKLIALNEVKEVMEADIPFAKRYLIDKQLMPLNAYKVKVKDDELIELKLSEKKIKLNVKAFDIETLSPERFSDPKKDPIIMASIVGEKEKVFCEKKINRSFIVKVESEKELIENVIKEINEADILITYNGDSFDLPYLQERAKQLKIKFGLGPTNEGIKIIRHGLENAVEIKGIIHLDAYKMLKILNKFATVNLIKFDLESVSERLLGQKKEKVLPEEINEAWLKEKNLERIADYNLNDSKTTMQIAKTFMPLMTEMTKLIKQPLFDVSRSSSSLLVEYLLMSESFKQNLLIPNNPSEEIVQQRMLQSFTGGYVKEPVPGLHENLAVLDFSSLHPTIMISHNISPDTLNCMHDECKQKNSAPTKDYFCIQKKGFLTEILEEIFNKRIELKKQLKKIAKESQEYKIIDARQHSLKIILNSFYGTLGYARFRWYSRECAAAVTAFSREYIKWVAEKAAEENFKTVYSDTDSAFLLIPKDKSKEDVIKFTEKINEELPGVMNLELEGFYKRGIFVTKREGERAAKKKYALIDYNNNLKIVGFEYVRRDWAPIAKNTQRKVLEAILKEGNPNEAIKIVKNTIKELMEGKVKKQDLIILTQVKRAINKYESIGPHIAAAMKAKEKGKEIDVGSVIGYIITKRGKSISDKAMLAEFVKEQDYDAEYYIKNQVIPAVIKIIREFNLSEEDLIQGGKQKTLNEI